MVVKNTKKETCKCEDSNTVKFNSLYSKLSNEICTTEENIILQIDKASEINKEIAEIMGDFAGICDREIKIIKLRQLIQQESLDYICSKIKNIEIENLKNMRKAVWHGFWIGVVSALVASLTLLGGKALWSLQ